MSARLREAIESTRLGFDVRESDIRSLNAGADLLGTSSAAAILKE